MNLSDAISLFLIHCRLERGLSSLTRTAYQLDLNQFLERQQKDVPLAVENIHKDIIRDHLGWLEQGYKPRSIKRKLATLKSFFAFLEHEEIVDNSPFRKMRLKIKQAKNLPRTISVSSIVQLLDCAYDNKKTATVGSKSFYDALRDIAVLETLFSTGVRVSELCKLKLQDVDIANRQILVMGKGKRERVIPLCDEAVVQALAEYKEHFADHHKPDTAFFLNRDRRPLSDQSVRQIIKKYQKQSRIPEEATPHMFRHTIATLMLENGVDIRNIQTFLGHSSLAVTEIYTHVSLSAQREALTKRHPRSCLSVGGRE